MPAPLIPAGRLREGLEVVHESIEQFSRNYRTWLTLAPAYSTGPALVRDHDDSTTTAAPFRPDAETMAKAYCPIAGPRWDEHRTRLIASTSIKGLTILRNQVEAELLTLQRIAAQNGNWDDPHPFSNGTHHIHYWEEILYVALTSGPIVAVQDRFSFDLNMALKRRKKLPRNKSKSINSQSAKVDIVSRAGNLWTRLYITKPERLRAEFREAESYMVDDSDDESDEEQDGPDDEENGNLIPTGLDGLPITDGPAMDAAAHNSSLMKTVRELRAAADTEAKARVGRSAESGRPNAYSKINVELVVTRIELPQDDASHTKRDVPFYQWDEQERFDARLCAIIREAKRYSVTIVPGFRRLPTSLLGGNFEYPSIGIHGSALPMGLPSVTSPPPRPRWRSTRKVNLDVTAMIALASDTTHGLFSTPPTSSLQQTPSPQPDLNGTDHKHSSDGLGTLFQHHFRTFSIRKEALEARAAELSLQADQQDEATKALDHAASKEGRALAIQLERELTTETLFQAILEPILGDHSSNESIEASSVQLYATVGVFDRLRRVSSTVGGPSEKRRVRALLGEPGTSPDDFWTGSKWSGPQHATLRASIQLPVQPLEDLGPGGFDSVEELAKLYPDLPRQHFISHMIDTLESCLTELWGPEWRDISEDLPRSKYKKLKQSSVHQAGGQTYTTLRSMHACARYGMTTLTSNMDSIQWLLKEMNRRPYSAMTRQILERASQQEWAELFDPDATHYPCFFLLHPRSLSEQMRVTTTAPPWREVLAGYPGDLNLHAPKDDADKISQAAATETPSTNGVVPVISYGKRELNGTEKAQRPFLDRAGAPGSGFSEKELPEKQQSDSYHSYPMSGENDSYAYDQRGPGDKRSLGSRLRLWLEGPRPYAKLRIRHYKWWPLAPVETLWLRFTDPVAWKDPFKSSSQHERLPISSSNRDPDEFEYADHKRRPHLGADWCRDIWADAKHNWLHWLLLCLTYIAWILAFAFVSESLWYDASVTGADGVVRKPYSFSCTSTYWLRNGECGMNGQDCAPFITGENSTGAAFRCPSGCADVTLLNPRTVGDQQENYVPLVVGGGDANRTYRADSFICAAAIHAGVLKESQGGCGSVRQVGAYAGYEGSSSNGIDSIGFNSTFPSSYRFEPLENEADCTDRRWQLYVMDVIMSAFVGLVLRPKRIVWFWTLACLGFWHINMASEPRDYPPPVGAAIGDFLPFLFCCYGIWRVSFRFVWPAFERLPIEREVWTLGFWWIGVLMNVVFADVPIQRLVARDIAQQPGSLTALIIIVVVVVVIAINQVRVIRKTGYLPKYLTLYVIGGILIGLAAAVPGETLRIHHYIIGLALLPACAFPTRLSLIYIALLLGIFTNGIARWGFDGLLQDKAVVQGDATGGTGIPSFLTTAASWASADGVVEWNAIPDEQRADWDGFMLLVDDVLRYQGDGTRFNVSELVGLFYEQQLEDGTAAVDNSTVLESPHFLRLAYASEGVPGDYTMAAQAFLAGNRTWIDAPAGAT